MNLLTLISGLGLSATLALLAAPPLQPVVEVEEEVYSPAPADNGAGPMWCSGSTCLARAGGEVFAAGLETVPDWAPLNNCRWTLWRREDGGWKTCRTDAAGRTREPSPLALLRGHEVWLSANPTLLAAGKSGGGPARPEFAVFETTECTLPPKLVLPEWNGRPEFTEHSYRSLAADGARGELILFQNVGYTHAEWTFFSGSTTNGPAWPARGQLKWPWGGEYAKPQPIRICYPNVALHNRAVHFIGVSDIIEPNERWRVFKRELTGREWDYDFRRLFYTWSRDVGSGRFEEWLELASRERTCGWISPGDLWIAPDGTVHIVWSERAIDERLRHEFFPEARQRWELNHAIVRGGRVIARHTLAAADEGRPGAVPNLARFQATPDHRLFVIAYFSGTAADGSSLSENRVAELVAGAEPLTWRTVPLRQPFNSFFTATPRAGSALSATLDLLGTTTGRAQTISYARVRLF